MKKIFIFIALSLVTASSAFGAASITIDFANAGKTLRGDKTTASATTPLIGKTSTGVGLGILVDATGIGYAVITQHKNGTKEFGSSYDSTSIYTAPVTTVGTALLGVPTAITSADFTTGTWTSM